MHTLTAVPYAFARDLFWFAGDLTIKATVVLAAAAVCTWAAKRSGAALRHRLWCSAYLTLLILPALLFALPKWPIPIPAWSFRAAASPSPTRTPSPTQPSGFAARTDADSTISRRVEGLAEVGSKTALAIDEASRDKLPEGRHFVSHLSRGPLVHEESRAEGSHGIAVPARSAETSAAADFGLGSGVLYGVLALLWLLGVDAYLLRVYAGFRASSRLTRSAVPVCDTQWLALLEEVQSSLRVPARVEMRESDGALTPLVSGILRPKIVLPRAGHQWPSALRRHVLVHELAHVKRRDLLLQLIGRLTTALYWFHPLAWYGLRRMQLEREIACDDYVLTVVERPSDYAAQLVDFARRMRGATHSWAACMASESTLEERVKSMLDRGRSHRPLSAWAAQALLATAVGGAALLATAQPGAQADVNDRPSKQLDRVSSTPPGPAASSTLAAVADSQRVTDADPASDGLVAFTGRILLPDGSPAANAFVSAIENGVEHGTTVTTVRTDGAGRFRLHSATAIDCALHASTSDGRLQSTLESAQDALDHPVDMRLSPARKTRVLVKSGGKPVAGARLVATAANRETFLVNQTSGPDGAATLWLPAGDGLRIDAWHPQLGVAQAQFVGKNGNERPTDVELALLPPKPRTIRVVDAAQRPVADLRLSIHGRASRNKWFSTNHIDEAAVRTNARGEVTLPWLPADVDHATLADVDGHWKLDNVRMWTDTDPQRATIQIRRLHPVTGRLIMPAGANPAGILVTGVGYGISAWGHRISARVRRDGTFTFFAAPDHGYWLGLSDSKWIADYWTGVVLTNDTAEPAKIAFTVSPAIPLSLHVTRGPKAEPWAGLFINATKRLEYKWTDSHGETQRMNGGVNSSRTTDAKGMAYFGAGRGTYQLVFWSNNRQETRTLDVTSNQPATVTFNLPSANDFHRSLFEKRDVAGRMTHRNKPRLPTSTTTLRAFSLGAGLSPAKVEMSPDGRFTVAAQTAHVYVFGTDAKEGLNAFRYLGPDDSMSDVVLKFVPSAIYSGQVVDEKGNPVVGCSVRLVPQEADGRYSLAFDFALAEAKVDEKGSFKIDQAPANVPLRALVVGLPKKVAPWGASVAEFKLQFSAGEVRRGDVLEVELNRSRAATPAAKSAAKKSAADRLSGLIRDARLSSTRVLVIAKGDSSAALHDVWGKLLDEAELRELLRYLPLLVSSEELKAEAALFTRLELQPPKAGEILLAVLDGEGRQVGALRLAVRNASSAVTEGVEFLKRYASPKRDARKLLSAAQQEARETGRRVWIIEGETRCGPCFRLARWLDDHHAPLERDYVFVKLLAGSDENVGDVLDKVKGRSGGGIPWFAITDPAGTVLVTSDGPGGNIGFPVDRIGKRHLRAMLERTARSPRSADMDHLLESLGD